uniref:Uncharacterized protein n=1 Tax=Grammatophora oceanica TaxID=210454 RepID=A0A7S1UV73_9STRA|mmetsp:Transcript_21019/g.31175  ORF Transcript_21019/g.31175 Transcript_21019/m.31175 type:complete len:311 (+) Transcript_21019:93-1025(+)
MKSESSSPSLVLLLGFLILIITTTHHHEVESFSSFSSSSSSSTRRSHHESIVTPSASSSSLHQQQRLKPSSVVDCQRRLFRLNAIITTDGDEDTKDESVHDDASSSLADNKQDSRSKKKNNKNSSLSLSYEERKILWMNRYGSCKALEETFGKAPSVWGDLTPTQTRQLYHVLLPRTLLALATEMNPPTSSKKKKKKKKPSPTSSSSIEYLAPLAYQARLAAKQYARSRCLLPARLATNLFDQYRNFKNHRKDSTSWEYLWEKYKAQILAEQQQEQAQEQSTNSPQKKKKKKKKEAATTTRPLHSSYSNG